MPALLREHTVCLSANKHQVRETKMRRSHRIPRREMRQRKKRKKEYKAEHRSVCVCLFVCLCIIGWRFIWSLLLLYCTTDPKGHRRLAQLSAAARDKCFTALELLLLLDVSFTSLHLTWCSSTALPSTFWQLNSTQLTHTHQQTTRASIQ